jgi:Fe-S-cluster containining protein
MPPDADSVAGPDMTERATCNTCGACCDPVTLPFTQQEAIEATGLMPRTRDWILHDLTPISRKEAKRKAAWVWSDRIGAKKMSEVMQFFYRCRWFDPESRLCSNWQNRPLPCSGYPWGDDPPRPEAALPPTCSFRADIGKPVEPMPEEWQQIILSRKPTLTWER